MIVRKRISGLDRYGGQKVLYKTNNNKNNHIYRLGIHQITLNDDFQRHIFDSGGKYAYFAHIRGFMFDETKKCLKWLNVSVLNNNITNNISSIADNDEWCIDNNIFLPSQLNPFNLYPLNDGIPPTWDCGQNVEAQVNTAITDWDWEITDEDDGTVNWNLFDFY